MVDLHSLVTIMTLIWYINFNPSERNKTHRKQNTNLKRTTKKTVSGNLKKINPFFPEST